MRGAPQKGQGKVVVIEAKGEGTQGIGVEGKKKKESHVSDQ